MFLRLLDNMTSLMTQRNGAKTLGEFALFSNWTTKIGNPFKQSSS